MIPPPLRSSFFPGSAVRLSGGQTTCFAGASPFLWLAFRTLCEWASASNIYRLTASSTTSTRPCGSLRSTKLQRPASFVAQLDKWLQMQSHTQSVFTGDGQSV